MQINRKLGDVMQESIKASKADDKSQASIQ